VEFRHGSWLEPDRLESVLHFFREHQLTYIVADEPQYGNLATILFLPNITTDIAYFRFHGRNSEHWLKKRIETSLRFAYLYSEDELKEFILHKEYRQEGEGNLRNVQQLSWWFRNKKCS
jgi:uncharacterized protein YecE (DUF72 family)